MRFILCVMLWTLLLVLSWPLAILVLPALPVLWLLSIPFRIVGAVINSLIAFTQAVLTLPARVLGYRG